MTQLAGQPPSFLRGVAINPGTPVQAVEPVLELADLVLVLAVNPGWSGQAPAANTRRRVAAVRDLAADCRSDVLVGVDGGVTIGNVAEIAGWKPDIIVSGSAIFDRRDPARNLELLAEALGRPVRVP
jgi:ribulose-phosphate 3-epimerase